MKYELDLVNPMRIMPPSNVEKPPVRIPTTKGRRDVRIATDLFLEAETSEMLTAAGADAMIVLAKVLDEYGHEPEIVHFKQAAKGLIEAGRSVFDAGMRVDDWEQAKVGAVMVEIVMRGIFICTGHDYEFEFSKQLTRRRMSDAQQGTDATDRAREDSGEAEPPPLDAA